MKGSRIEYSAAACSLKTAAFDRKIFKSPIQMFPDAHDARLATELLAANHAWFIDYKVQLCNLRGHSMSVRKKVSK